uniref:Protein kinase domain-containing protein n=1 Tax=Mycena chlorophos TaxID=658473 RepID=A0ABQ0LSN2_MYCCL|nr:predicted protein [Mycena chlorophos]
MFRSTQEIPNLVAQVIVRHTSAARQELTAEEDSKRRSRPQTSSSRLSAMSASSNRAFRLVSLGGEMDNDIFDTEGLTIMTCYNLLFQSNGEYFVYHIDGNDYDYSPEGMRLYFESASLVPPEYYRAKIPPALADGSPPTAAPLGSAMDPDVYLKISGPRGYDPTIDPAQLEEFTQAKIQLQELRICEILRASPHPNICRYLGYLRHADGVHIAGLCFQRHVKNLRALVEELPEGEVLPLETCVRIMDGIESGLRHLHGLGFAHNDLNPENVMLDKFGQAVVIDFDSCVEIGASMSGNQGTTFGWEYENTGISKAENDLWALSEIARWLGGKRTYYP